MGGQLAPAPRPQRAEAVAAALRHKTEIKKCERETEKNTLSFSPPPHKKKDKFQTGMRRSEHLNI